jgi:transcriptional regulator with XRE-family HTH domain
MTLSEFFLNERLERGLSLRRASDGIGISVSYLCSIENGKKNPTQKTIDLLCKFYDKDLWHILFLIWSLDDSVDEKLKKQTLLKLKELLEFQLEFTFSKVV